MTILLLSSRFPSPPYGGALIRIQGTVHDWSRRHRSTQNAPIPSRREPQQFEPLTDYCETIVARPVSKTIHAVLRRLATGLVQGMPTIQNRPRDRGLAPLVRRRTSLTAYGTIRIEIGHSFVTPYLASVSRQSRARTISFLRALPSREQLAGMGTAAVEAVNAIGWDHTARRYVEVCAQLVPC